MSQTPHSIAALELIHARIDLALSSNRRVEYVLVGMSSAIFALGIGTIVAAYWLSNVYLSSGTVICQSFLYWPIREIILVRRQNIMLQTVPALITLSELSQNQYSKQLEKFLDSIQKK